MSAGNFDQVRDEAVPHRRNPPTFPAATASMHEIITLQLGQQANYLGTHFWNAQVCYVSVPPGMLEVDDDVGSILHLR